MTLALERESAVGTLLRTWRERRRLTQMQLALTTDVSARHLSFVETGRSRPTPQMIDRLAESLEVPLRERNELFLAAGYAPRYAERDLMSPELHAVADAFRALLDAHLPHPALVLDRWWDIVDRNAATDPLLAGCATELLEPPVNVIRLSLHPAGLAPRIRNLGQWRAFLLGQVRHRFERTADPRLADLLEEVSTYSHTAGDPGTGTGARGNDVVVPLRLLVDGAELAFFSIAASVVSATDVTLDDLHIEAFYPADAFTAEKLRGATAAR
ncbi:helix-turn-helix transcriptional regulator [Microbacterium sp.]|uniref:helix-turn-helix domain-containing protein n=1 Tax=Microbacterium sp. TaxID=51671 RepID=UPI002811A70A|nr:helix-turn-helix transcriptional regulator [Microbacterium sp.]